MYCVCVRVSDSLLKERDYKRETCLMTHKKPLPYVLRLKLVDLQNLGLPSLVCHTVFIKHRHTEGMIDVKYFVCTCILIQVWHFLCILLLALSVHSSLRPRWSILEWIRLVCRSDCRSQRSSISCPGWVSMLGRCARMRDMQSTNTGTCRWDIPIARSSHIHPKICSMGTVPHWPVFSSN